MRGGLEGYVSVGCEGSKGDEDEDERDNIYVWHLALWIFFCLQRGDFVTILGL
jgi:hypothetical protein